MKIKGKLRYLYLHILLNSPQCGRYIEPGWCRESYVFRWSGWSLEAVEVSISPLVLLSQLLFKGTLHELCDFGLVKCIILYDGISAHAWRDESHLLMVMCFGDNPGYWVLYSKFKLWVRSQSTDIEVCFLVVIKIRRWVVLAWARSHILVQSRQILVIVSHSGDRLLAARILKQFRWPHRSKLVKWLICIMIKWWLDRASWPFAHQRMFWAQISLWWFISYYWMLIRFGIACGIVLQVIKHLVRIKLGLTHVLMAFII